MFLRSLRPWAVLAALCLTAAGCAATPRVSVRPGFTVSPELETVYVVPFASTLVPPEVSSAVFDQFVDLLNDGRGTTPVQQFVIIKDDLKNVDPGWLAEQVYITGDLWGYLENSGCCSTELKVKARAYLYERAAKIPSVEVTVPLETFYDHDRAAAGSVRQKLADRAARELSSRILGVLRR